MAYPTDRNCRPWTQAAQETESQVRQRDQVPPSGAAPAADWTENWIYGGDSTRIAGDTTYRIIRDVDARLETIRDPGGYDTIFAVQASLRVYINLNPGGLSMVRDYPLPYSRFVIGDGSVIESAVGSYFDDWIVGNSANNTLYGVDGPDTLEGGPGDDTIVGSQEPNYLIDGAPDVAVFSGPMALYSRSETVTGIDAVVTGPDGTDTLKSIALVQFSDTGKIPLYNIPTKVRFDPAGYLAGNPDLLTAFGLNTAAATDHYLQFGWKEKRSYSRFDPAMYLASNPDLIDAFGADTAAATRHYIQWGYAAGRPTVSFEAARYLASNPDLLDLYRTDMSAAALQYVQSGRAAGRQITFDPAAYLAANPDVAAATKGNPSLAIWHYISSGWAEGRTTKPGTLQPALTETTDYDDEVKASGGNTGKLLLGNSARGTIGSSHDVDLYRLSLKAGDVVTVSAFYSAGMTVAGTGPKVALLNPAGDFFISQFTNKLQATATKTGDFWISIEGGALDPKPYWLLATGVPVAKASGSTTAAAGTAPVEPDFSLSDWDYGQSPSAAPESSPSYWTAGDTGSATLTAFSPAPFDNCR